MGRKRPHISDEERDLFRRSMADVKPMAQDKVLLRSPPPEPEPHQRKRDEAAVLEELRRDPFNPMDHATGDEALYRRPSVDRATFRRLRRGLYSIEGQLDLHGLNAEQAERRLGDFLRTAQAQHWRCVRIIHGKGNRSPGRESVLKQLVHRRLRKHAQVLAFCSAPPNDGGTGAVYVLLRRLR
ncbi:MAG: hypothetical protein Kow006_28430 [Gammaproteobacteria bacterium]